MDVDLGALCIPPAATLQDAIACIDRSEALIALVVDEARRLIGTITDGDVRRAILAGEALDSRALDLLVAKADSVYRVPVTAHVDTAPEALLQLMRERGVRQVPLVDAAGCVCGLVTQDELTPGAVPLQAVVMAGGFGRRLHPLTDATPKPMLRVGDRPLMELILEQLRQGGVQRVNIATHYLSEQISEHFGDGKAFGIELSYVNEDSPLGTAGALGLLAEPSEPILVINGDILTNLDFRALLAFHREHAAALTVAVRRYEVRVPYGVVETDGVLLRRIVEKPSFDFFVNAGIYLLDPVAHKHIPHRQHFHMTELIDRLIGFGLPVASFPIREYWLDIGSEGDYVQAQQDVREGRHKAWNGLESASS